MWPPFCRRYFQTYFNEWRWCVFIIISLKFIPRDMVIHSHHWPRSRPGADWTSGLYPTHWWLNSLYSLIQFTCACTYICIWFIKCNRVSYTAQHCRNADPFCRDITHSVTMTPSELESDLNLTADTPCLVQSSEPWRACREEIGENWPR